MTVVDIHAHCVPQTLLAVLSRDDDWPQVEVLTDGAVTRLRVGGRLTRALHQGLADPAARLSAMDAMGVEMQVLSLFVDLCGYTLPPDAGLRYARLVNDSLAATAALHPDRLRALATVPLQAPEPAAAELLRAVGELGLLGVQLGICEGAVDLDAEAMRPFWEAAEALRCLVLIHPGSASRTDLPYTLGNLVGNPADTTLAAARLVFGGVLDRHPDLRVCLVHGGGFMPYQIGRWDRAVRAVGARLNARLPGTPGELLRRFWYDTILHSPPMLAVLVGMVGADRVLLGSDFPFEMGDPDPRGTVAAVPGLGPAERALVEGGNAAALFAAVRR